MPIVIALIFMFIILGAAFDNIDWGSPLTYIIALFLLGGFASFGFTLTLIILAGVTWYFRYTRPQQAQKQARRERAEIRAEARDHGRQQARERSKMRYKADRQRTRAISEGRRQAHSVLYRQIMAKETEKNNLTSQMGNLYNTAMELKKRRTARSETNAMFNQIGDLKQRKIDLCMEIDDLKTNGRRRVRAR